MQHTIIFTERGNDKLVHSNYLYTKHRQNERAAERFGEVKIKNAKHMQYQLMITQNQLTNLTKEHSHAAIPENASLVM